MQTLARCPICQETVQEAVDTMSLNGQGWGVNEPHGFGWYGPISTITNRVPRGKSSYHTTCPHIQGMIYGVNLNSILPDDVDNGWIIISSEQPGLLAPFMNQAGSYAVIHTLPVGRLDEETWHPRYTAYFIAYFQADRQVYLDSLPKDPTDQYFYWLYDQYDYNLLPWLEKGKLFWLGSEADGFPLLNGPVSDYPYTQLKGLIGRWYINCGRLGLIPTQVPQIGLYATDLQVYKKIKPLQKQLLRQRNLRPLSHVTAPSLAEQLMAKLKQIWPK